MLLRESKGLLIGEAADPAVRRGVMEIVACTDGVVAVHSLLTTHLAPDQVVAALSVDFADELDVRRVERIVDDMDERVRRQHPQIVALFVKPQSAAGYERAHRYRVGEDEAG